MRKFASVTVLVFTSGVCLADDKVQSFNAYVDSDICSHLMLGPISETRMDCTKKTYKQGSEPNLVRLRDNLVFAVNKQKMLKPLVGQLAVANGELKEKDGRIKLSSVEALSQEAIKQGSPEYELLDVRHFRLSGEGAKVREKVRHELAMMPYVSEFDFISFMLVGERVILTGWTVRQTNRSTAQNLAKSVEGVREVTNNIDVLPLGSFDMQIRAAARAALQRHLSRYFWGSGSAIKIVVKNGSIILLGTVANQSDVNIATIQCNSVHGAFTVFNMLRVESEEDKKR